MDMPAACPASKIFAVTTLSRCGRRAMPPRWRGDRGPRRPRPGAMAYSAAAPPVPLVRGGTSGGTTCRHRLFSDPFPRRRTGRAPWCAWSLEYWPIWRHLR
jgi:hypothetical protein